MSKRIPKRPRSILSVCLRDNIKRAVQVEAERQRLTASQWAARLIEDALTARRAQP